LKKECRHGNRKSVLLFFFPFFGFRALLKNRNSAPEPGTYEKITADILVIFRGYFFSVQHGSGAKERFF